MSTPDEMGLTPEAALGYEQFFVPAIFCRWPPKIIAVAEITDGDDVLDAGCGTGVLTREMVHCVGETGSVTGVDLSESMLGVARQACPGVDFQQGNVNELPFEDLSFDVVVSSFMLMFVPDPTKVVSEMRRVLRPGGRIVVSVWQGLDNNPVYDALVRATREVIDVASANSMAWPFTMGDAGKLTDIFSAAGLEGVSISAHEGIAEFPSVEGFVNTEIQAWLLADSVNAHQIEDIGLKLRVKYPEFAESSGAIKFPLNALIAKIATD